MLHSINFRRYKEAGLTEIVERDVNGEKVEVERIKDWSKRMDHRHHAVDALTIACTKQGYIQRINNLSSLKEVSFRSLDNEEQGVATKQRLTSIQRYIQMQPHIPTAEVEKARNLFRRELEWIRSTPCARTGKAKYRIDAFNSLKEKTVGDFDEKKININVKSSRLGTKIINCKDVSFSYSDRPMLKEFTYNFARGEKVGIVGDNGVGKSTFLKLLCGDLEPQSGELSRGETLVFGHYRQEGISFNENDTIFDAVHDIAEVVTLADGKQVPVSTFLNYFLFPPQTHRTKISRLSGGEKRRLYLLTILMKNPNFLILDEPTNDLDIITLNVLEEYLESFSGSLLIVSHDRYFLDKIADHIFIFKGNGEVKDFVGKYSEYRAIQDYEKENSQTSEKSKKSDNKEYKKEQPEKKKRLSFKEQRLYDQLTLECSNLEEEKLKLETELNNGSLPIDKLTEASKRIGEIMDLLDEKTLLILELEESISI